MLQTEKAIIIATDRAITRTPFPTYEPVPTGTREGTFIKIAGEKLGMDAENGWSGWLDGSKVAVYAGSYGDPSQGVLEVLISAPHGFDGRFLTPARHGAVRVIGEQHNRLILQTKDGTLFYFDLAARRYVSSMTEVALTATPASIYPPVTPSPTFHPYPYPHP
jgi:hypothetical protein